MLKKYMDRKIVEIIKTLKAANINAYPFGGNTPLKTPYTIVKEEKDSLERGSTFRVIVHVSPGNCIEGDQLLLDIINLLWEPEPGTFDPQWFAMNSDKTLSREQVFLFMSKY